MEVLATKRPTPHELDLVLVVTLVLIVESIAANGAIAFYASAVPVTAAARGNMQGQQILLRVEEVGERIAAYQYGHVRVRSRASEVSNQEFMHSVWKVCRHCVRHETRELSLLNSS